MSDELTKLRLGKQIPAKDMVAVVQELYPAFDKTMLSKSEHGDRYGVTLRRDAMDALIDTFAPEAKAAFKKRRAGGHRLTCKIACRLENDDYSALQQAIRANGYATTQDWLSDIVKEYIISHKSKGTIRDD